MKKFRIKVRLRKNSDIHAEPFYHTDAYDAINRNVTLYLMAQTIWSKFKCYNPEVMEITELE